MKKCSLLPYKNEIDLNNRWECALKGIYFHIPSQDAPVYLLINDRVSFNLSSNIFLVTKKMFDIFTYVFLGKYIDKEICRIVTHGYFNLIDFLPAEMIVVSKFGVLKIQKKFKLIIIRQLN